MRKIDLLEFIERVNHKAVVSVQVKWNSQIEAKKAEYIAKYDEKINMYQSSFNNFSNNLTNLLTDMKEDKEVGYNGSVDIRNGLSYLRGIKSSIVSNCDFQGEVQKLKNLKLKEIEEVKTNYNTVYTVCKGMSSANRIAEYLEELGFDVSSIRDKNMTALVAQVDKSKLFVCGDNK